MDVASDGLFVSDEKNRPDEKAILHALLRQSPAGFVVIDASGTVLLVNRAARRMFDCDDELDSGISWGELHRRSDLRFADGEPVVSDNDPLFLALRKRRYVTKKVRITTKGTRPERWVSFSAFPVFDHKTGFIASAATILDITDLKGMQDILYHQATHDHLTGLPNRAYFSGTLAKTLARAKRGKSRGAIMTIDLDDFKRINDTMGHAAGDELLTKVADRLMGEVRESDVVARVGGDEFNILLADMEIEDQAAMADQIARRICESLGRPFSIWGHNVHVTSSIGVSLFPRDGLDEETLLFRADIAMYRVKEQGRNNWCFWSAPQSSDEQNEQICAQRRGQLSKK